MSKLAPKHNKCPIVFIAALFAVGALLALWLTMPVRADDPVKRAPVQIESPNILFILTDNQPAEALACYGNVDFETPNLDQLAREGVLFTRAFSTHGFCSPSRASILTGLLASQHGVHSALRAKLTGHPDNWNPIHEFRTLSLTLKNRGYRTAMIGKWHLGHYNEPSVGYELG